MQWASGSSANSQMANIRFDNPYSGPPGEFRGFTSHQDKIDALRNEAIEYGAEAAEIDKIIGRYFFEAAQNNLGDKWVLENVRPELRAIIAKLRHDVEYSENEDSATIPSHEFIMHVQPPIDRYMGWDDAAGRVMRDFFGDMLCRMDELRDGSLQRLVVVESSPAERASPTGVKGMVATDDDVAEVVACLCMGIEVRFQVHERRRPVSDKRVGEWYETSKFASPEPESEIAKILKSQF